MKDPKSAAGKRPGAFPASIVPDVRRHMEWFAQRQAGGWVFIGPKGGRLRRNNFNRIWKRALRKAGVPEIHFHDLRHTANTLATATGASTRELMGRIGHASAWAALIYQHRTDERDREIADGVDARTKKARTKTGEPKRGGRERGERWPGREASGTDLARGQ